MKMPRLMQALGLPAGFVGLVGDLLLLNREPLFDVLGTRAAWLRCWLRWQVFMKAATNGNDFVP